MSKLLRVSVLLSFCVSVGLVGCGGGEGVKTVKLVPVSGTVTYKGGPLAGARITFVPEKGPLAMAQTEVDGTFKLKSGALNGCAVGKAQVAVSIPTEAAATPQMTLNPSPKTPEEMAENSRKMAEMTTMQQKSAESKKAESLIPLKYAEAATSGLSFTIEPGGNKDLVIELKD